MQSLGGSTNPDKVIGGHFENGLATLKQLAETRK